MSDLKNATETLGDADRLRAKRVAALEKRRKGSQDLTQAVFLVDVSDKELASMNLVNHIPVAVRVNLALLHDPLLKRLALGIGSTNSEYEHLPIYLKESTLVFENKDGEIVCWEWDTKRPDESPEAYLVRHYEKMQVTKYISLPTEPTFMQATIAQKWAHQLGFPIPLPTVRKHIKEGGRIFYGTGHAHTGSFFYYLMKWGKRI